MEADDHHYYCCGDCQALFSTLSGLSRHKAKCDGTKLLDGTYDLYAYKTTYLQKLIDCLTQCQHRELCPVITQSTMVRKAPAQQRSKNSGRILNKKGRAMELETERNQKRVAQGEDQQTGSPLVKRRKATRQGRLSVKCVMVTATPPDPLLQGTPSSQSVLNVADDPGSAHVKQEIPDTNDHSDTAISQRHEADNRLLCSTKSEMQHISDSSTSAHLPLTQAEDVITDVSTEQTVGTAESGNPRSEKSESSSAAKVKSSPDISQSQMCDPTVQYVDDSPSPCIQRKSQRQNRKTHKDKPKQTPRNLSISEQLSKFRQEFPVEGKATKALFYVCDVCNWKTRHMGFFLRHQKCHNGSVAGSRWACEECDFTCKSTNELKIHTDKHTKPFMCEFCSRRFARKMDLSRHLYLHSGEMPFKCSLCEYSCRQSKSLSEHMRKHTGEQICCAVEGCTFKTVYKWAMKAHYQNKHITEKRLQCLQCPYKTNDSTSMLRHKRLHDGEKNFKCSMCNYRAVVKHEIVRHMRSHTKEKLYFCDRCNYSTAHASALRIHMMNHLGVKPWQCVVCGYNSLTRSKVLRHVRQIHKGQWPQDPNDAVANLGLKLDLNIKEYKTPQEGSSSSSASGAAGGSEVVYDIQGVVQECDVEAVELIVQELPAEEGSVEVPTTSDKEDGTNRLETLDLSSIEGLQQFRQLAGNIEVKHVTLGQPGDQSVLQQAPQTQEDGSSVVQIQQVCEGEGPETWQVVEIESGPQEEGLVIEPQEEVINAVEVGEAQGTETCVVSVQGGDIQWTEDGHMVVDGNHVQVIYREES